jgi:aspartyl-tRNA(Asn)/glutamyl-tRNA(Gln) amidotransferase subunit C
METTFSKEDVLRVAKLSGLELKDEEIKKFQSLIVDALAYVRLLKSVQTSGVIPTYQVTGLANIASPDSSERSTTLTIDEVFKNVKIREKEGYFSVKKVI